MSYPSKTERQACWDARDKYWECLDKNELNEKKCEQLKIDYEKMCPSLWVNHFARKRRYEKFKEEHPHDFLSDVQK